MRKVLVHNVQKACIPNRLDEELIKEFFKRNGFVIVKDYVQADIILINTCGYVSQKEDEAIEAIIKFQNEKKPGTKIIVCGCLPDINKKRLKEVFRGETFGPRSIEKLDRIINAKIKISDVNKHFYKLNHCFPDVMERQDLEIDSFNINIGIGCLGNCSYCAIKNARGTIKSKPVKEIMREFRCGLRQGYKNFALWGDDTGAYGKDLNTNIIELIKKMFKERGEYKFHINRFNPNWLIPKFDELKELLKSNKISYISVPVQSGNQSILNLMKREYSIEDFKRCIKTLNREFPSLKIRTEVIVGFPGEGEEEFNDTLKLFDGLKFYKVYAVEYDQRPYTEAYNMKKQVPYSIKRERAIIIRKMFEDNEKSSLKINARKNHSSQARVLV